jgi:hypothetical protein
MILKKSYKRRHIIKGHIGRAPVIIVCCADLKAFKEFPERVDELIESGALPERNERSIYSIS